MPTVDERLASLEARMDRMDDLQNLIVGLRTDTNRQFDQTNRQFEQMRADTNRQFEQTNRQFEEMRADTNRQFEQTNRQFEQMRTDMNRQFEQMRADMNRQFDQMYGRFERLDQRTDTIDAKADKHFVWLVGLQMTVMLAVIGALLGAYLRQA